VNRLKKLLQKLTDTPGPSGYEEKIRALIQMEIKSFSSDIRIDGLGNLIMRMKPLATVKKPKKVLVAAHMDETGVVAKHIDEYGFVWFATLGSVLAQYSLGARVQFLNGTRGIIASNSLSRNNEIPKLSEMYIDVGVSNINHHPVTIGDIATFDIPFLDLGDRLVAKSLDNRVGVLILIETIRTLKTMPHDVYFVFTAHQQGGVQGLGPIGFDIAPDLALVVDIGSSDPSTNHLQLGSGPGIKIADSLSISDPRVTHWMTRAAENKNIHFQREVAASGDSYASQIQTTRNGIPTGGLSVPLRYGLSFSQMVDKKDIQNSIKLLTAILQSQIEL